jgi:AcrR family transcriptional regulator
VSHQAPYKHFPSRDHILAEAVRQAFAHFASHLDARPMTGEPWADLGAMGHAYLSYALEHPLHYRLMFGTPLPDPLEHPAMMEQARHAFQLLRDAVSHLPGRQAPAELDAMFVWAVMHGTAGILHGQALEHLSLPAGMFEREGVPAIFERISRGLGAGDPPSGKRLKP